MSVFFCGVSFSFFGSSFFFLGSESSFFFFFASFFLPGVPELESDGNFSVFWSFSEFSGSSVFSQISIFFGIVSFFFQLFQNHYRLFQSLHLLIFSFCVVSRIDLVFLTPLPPFYSLS